MAPVDAPRTGALPGGARRLPGPVSGPAELAQALLIDAEMVSDLVEQRDADLAGELLRRGADAQMVARNNVIRSGRTPE